MAYRPEEWKEQWHEFAVVVAGFRAWLEADGWNVRVDEEDTDVIATKADQTIVAEAKGTTKGGKAKGIHTVYGQILRRMTPERVADPNTSFAVVVPASSKDTALRVPEGIRDLLRITIYSVTDDGTVQIVRDGSPA